MHFKATMQSLVSLSPFSFHKLPTPSPSPLLHSRFCHRKWRFIMVKNQTTTSASLAGHVLYVGGRDWSASGALQCRGAVARRNVAFHQLRRLKWLLMQRWRTTQVGWLAGLSAHCNMQHASSVGVDDLSLPTLLEAVLFFLALLTSLLILGDYLLSLRASWVAAIFYVFVCVFVCVWQCFLHFRILLLIFQHILHLRSFIVLGYHIPTTALASAACHTVFISFSGNFFAVSFILSV